MKIVLVNCYVFIAILSYLFLMPVSGKANIKPLSSDKLKFLCSLFDGRRTFILSVPKFDINVSLEYHSKI